MGLIYEPLNQNFFAAMLVPLFDAGEVWVGAVTARQVLPVEGRVFADQVAVGLVDVGIMQLCYSATTACMTMKARTATDD